jgi:HAD superfamily hydrolase (TIGR01484 family)
MNAELLLCTDLDRTLVPNGNETESPDARSLFGLLAARPDVTLAYVSGRDAPRVKSVIEQFDLPTPDFVVGDVGTSIFEIHSSDIWRRNPEWDADIAQDWGDTGSDRIDAALANLAILEAQEPSKQGRFKRSFYFDSAISESALASIVRDRLSPLNLPTTLVYSVDEPRNLGLLDVLPERANKLHAVSFLLGSLDLAVDRVLYCGDSGNDLAVLASAIPGVLVANASSAVRNEARRLAVSAGNAERLYIARGGFMNMNGNYAAGILEGACHFFPRVYDWLSSGRTADDGTA